MASLRPNPDRAILALASSDVSGRSRIATEEGRLGNLPSRRPSALHSVEVRCDCDYTVVKYHFISYGQFPQFWTDPHWQVRYVYWTGREVMFSQWMKRMTEYPIFRSYLNAL